MKHTTSAADPKAFKKLQDLVRDIDIAMVTTVTPDGTLHSRPMVTRAIDDHGVIWFFTADDSGKARDLALERGVNASYADPKNQRFVSVTGNASIVHDAKKAAQLWHAGLAPYFPRGLEDPHLALLCVRIEFAEYWDAPSSRMRRLFTLGDTSAGVEKVPADNHTLIEVRATPASG
jgi:general stress protein 26